MKLADSGHVLKAIKMMVDDWDPVCGCNSKLACKSTHFWWFVDL